MNELSKKIWDVIIFYEVIYRDKKRKKKKYSI